MVYSCLLANVNVLLQEISELELLRHFDVIGCFNNTNNNNNNKNTKNNDNDKTLY